MSRSTPRKEDIESVPLDGFEMLMPVYHVNYTPYTNCSQSYNRYRQGAMQASPLHSTPPPPLRGLSNGSQIGIIDEVIGDNSHAMTPSPSNPFLHKDGAARFARTSSQADLLLAVYINKEEVE